MPWKEWLYYKKFIDKSGIKAYVVKNKDHIIIKRARPSKKIIKEIGETWNRIEDKNNINQLNIRMSRIGREFKGEYESG